MKGQTIAEYIIIVGIVVMAIYAMGPMFKRAVQITIKSTADQLASQKNSEQDYSEETSHLENATTNTKSKSERLVSESVYTKTFDVKEDYETVTNSLTDMGFSPQ